MPASAQHHQCIDCDGTCYSPCLASFAPDQEAMRQVLDKIVPERKAARLNVTTRDPNVISLEDRCRGTYDCPCRRCGAERSSIRAQGEGNANPFKAAA